MPKVTYIDHEGLATEVELNEGWTLMQGATANGVEGIEGECGGSCACATCHVYVDDAYWDKLPPAEEMEIEMLECVESERKSTSRLSCQLRMSPELDGIVLHLPQAQS